MKRRLNKDERNTTNTSASDPPEDEKKNKRKKLQEQVHNHSSLSASNICVVTVVLLAIAVVAFNTYELRTLRMEQLNKTQEKSFESSATTLCINSSHSKPKVQLWSPRVNMKHLSHVSQVFTRLGYRFAESDNDTDWDVLWAHDYPFHVLKETLRSLKPYQKVNKFPGSGYVTTKVSLATSGSPFIPPAFKIPQDKDKLLEYAASHPDSLFVEKSNDHRAVHLKSLKDIDFNSTNNFVQEFMSRPLLISGHKFDIGVYTVITSVNPLRIYKFDGEVLFRFCLEPYEPFDSRNREQYVIGEDYLPSWKVPALKHYSELTYSRREAFDAYIKSTGKNPARIWNQIDEAISSIYLRKEKLISDLVARYKSRRSFFELVRFDFIVDEDLSVYMLEANMSPNLSSVHYPANALMYEQIIYSVLALVGVASYTHPPHPQSSATQDMIVSERNLMVYPEVCNQCDGCEDPKCHLCRPCLQPDILDDFSIAYSEHLNRHRCKRIFPPPMTQAEAAKGLSLLHHQNLTTKNQLMVRWFQGKCLLDVSWCQ